MMKMRLQWFGGRGGNFDTARNIIGQYDITEITDSRSKIVSFYKHIDENGGIRLDEERGKIKVTHDAMERAQDLAEELSERILERDRQAETDYRDIRRLLSGEYAISEQDRSNIPDFSAYVRSRENFLKIRQNGMSIDSAYQELAQMYPQYFNAKRVTNPADQLQDINRVLGQLRDNARQLPPDEQAAAARDLRSSLILGYITTQERRGRRYA